MTRIETIKIEFKKNFNLRNPKPVFLVLFYRCSNFIAYSNLFVKLIGFPVRILYRIIVEWLMGIEIPDTTKIGAGLRIHHGIGIVINPNVEIGENCTIKHAVTIGCGTDLQDNCISYPKLGDNVIIHPGAMIFGDIKIGNNVIIGASSLVNKSFPSASIVAGVPAKIIRHLNA